MNDAVSSPAAAARRTTPLEALVECAHFASKEARACVFAGAFFAAMIAVPRAGVLGVPRYDVLLAIAIGMQVWLVATGRETRDELKAIGLFHALGFGLELYKTSPAIAGWSYPEEAWTKVAGVPLFAGFMYAAVGSYVIQAWRLLDLRVENHPPFRLAALLSVAIYVNFFTHHHTVDLRWALAAIGLALYAPTVVVFRPHRRERRMPMALAFVLTGFFVWLAENAGTFLGFWVYPHQIGAWSRVDLVLWSSWTLLIVMTFTIVCGLKHVKARVAVRGRCATRSS